MSNFYISVIIPVFNKVIYVKQCILSAHVQPEVNEIIAIDDGSSDGSYEKLLELQKEITTLKVLIHVKHKNKGVSCSRNLGIKNAKNDFIAFLDADDYFLEDRFVQTKKIFNLYPYADGVYECVGTISNNQIGSNIMLREKIVPEKLFETLLIDGHKGWFSADGLTLKKHVFNTVGLFNTKLVVAEDTEMWFKISALFKLYPGDLSNLVAIARRNVSKGLTVTENYKINNKILWSSLLKWSLQTNISFNRKTLLFERVLEYNSYYWGIRSKYQKKVFKLIVFLKYTFYHPKFIFKLILIKIRT